MWEYIVIGTLTIVFIILLYFLFSKESTVKSVLTERVIYPFSGYLAPPGVWGASLSSNNVGTSSNPSEGLSLVGMRGGETNDAPQIQCPLGTKINIIGAFFDVADVNGVCSQSPDPTMLNMCGDTSAISQKGQASCGVDADCGAGMSCTLNKCTPKFCNTPKDCGGRVCPASNLSSGECEKNGGIIVSKIDENGVIVPKCIPNPKYGACYNCLDNKCILSPVCNAVIKPGTRNTETGEIVQLPPMCVSNSNTRARPRDASAYLADYCDGKRDCFGMGDRWSPLSPKGFGPMPTDISPSSQEYATRLPVNLGFGGGNIDNSTNFKSPSFQQGFYVHGAYTCVPE